MKFRWSQILASLALAVPYAASTHAADPGVTLVGVGEIPGSALDKSGL